MSLPVLAAVVIVALVAGYHFYGGFIARQYELSETAEMPSERHADGIDFVPTQPFYLLSQHFSAIAAAGPIAGPILACKQFGWLPSILWIGFGVDLHRRGARRLDADRVGAARRRARSPRSIRENLGARAWVAMMTFIWVALVYVIVAFTDLTASTFVGGGPELRASRRRSTRAARSAMASVLYLDARRRDGARRPLAQVATLAADDHLRAGDIRSRCGRERSSRPCLVLDAKVWAILILIYCFFASLMPVWGLLQPRGYLGGFVLYSALAVGTIGIFFGDFQVQQPAFKGLRGAGPDGPPVSVPVRDDRVRRVLRIPRARVLGHHVQAGRARDALPADRLRRDAARGIRRVDRARHDHDRDEQQQGAGPIYGEGLGASSPSSSARSTCARDDVRRDGVLDVRLRHARRVDAARPLHPAGALGVAEPRRAAIVATAATCAVPLAFLLAAGPGSYMTFWTLFGTSNQLLASLSLLGITVWLKRSGRPYWFAALPMAFVLAVTVTALVLQASSAFSQAAGLDMAAVNGVVAVTLLALAGGLVAYAARAFRAAAAVSG
jgi:carbon starvation protein